MENLDNWNSVGDVGAVHHVLVLVGHGGVLGLMVGVELLASS